MQNRYSSVLFLWLVIGSLSAADSYYVHNLVSDVSGLADHLDPNLINPWGNAFSSDSRFWIADNGAGTSTLYDGVGNGIPLVVNIPSPLGSTIRGRVTGVAFNGNQNAFLINGKQAFFLFCTEDGTISGWNPSVDQTHARLMIDNSRSGATYTGCTLGGTSASPWLYAADYANNKIDVWDANLHAVLSTLFLNPVVPSGFAPFNIQNLNGTLYVSYSPLPRMSNPNPHAYATPHGISYSGAGTSDGGGYVAAFSMSGALILSMNGQDSFNYPWGMTIAAASFGDFANALLIGNFGDGMIHAVNPASGALLGTLNDTKGEPIAIDGLRSLNFGNGEVADAATLYFTAGIQGQSHGLFGNIQGPPFFNAAQILNAASFDTRIAANSYVAIRGGALAATSRVWTSSDFLNNSLPTQLDGVSVRVNGEAAYVAFISPTQLNILVPPDVPPGPAQIQVTNNGVTSTAQAITLLNAAPGFFAFGPPNASGNQYIAATHAVGTLGGPQDYVQGVVSTPFTEGETIILYGNGFGATTPPVPKGQLLMAAAPLANTPKVTIGGLPAEIRFAGLSAAGLYQFNVVVPRGLTPATTANIDVPVVIEVGASRTQTNAVIAVANPKM